MNTNPLITVANVEPATGPQWEETTHIVVNDSETF
jgi:hypothetical protein